MRRQNEEEQEVIQVAFTLYKGAEEGATYHVAIWGFGKEGTGCLDRSGKLPGDCLGRKLELSCSWKSAHSPYTRLQLSTTSYRCFLFWSLKLQFSFSSHNFLNSKSIKTLAGLCALENSSDLSALEDTFWYFWVLFYYCYIAISNTLYIKGTPKQGMIGQQDVLLNVLLHNVCAYVLYNSMQPIYDDNISHWLCDKGLGTNTSMYCYVVHYNLITLGKQS